MQVVERGTYTIAYVKNLVLISRSKVLGDCTDTTKPAGQFSNGD